MHVSTLRLSAASALEQGPTEPIIILVYGNLGWLACISSNQSQSSWCSCEIMLWGCLVEASPGIKMA